MVAHRRPFVYVATLSTRLGENLTLDSQAGWIDADASLAAACGHANYILGGGRQMKEAIWNRVGPVTGILFFGLVFTGLFVHGYPDIRPTDAQLAKWLASIDVNRFSLGIYIEAVGYALFLPFAAWLYGHLKQRGVGASWPAVAMLAAAAAWVILTLPINELYVGMLEQARRGLDIRVAQTVVSINQAWFEMTSVLLALTLLAAGVSILRGAAMSRWAGWAAVAVGLTLFLPAAALFLQPVGYLWFLAVAGYYTFRPAWVREVVASTAQPTGATGLPAAR
jgi:hypothetical protein